VYYDHIRFTFTRIEVYGWIVQCSGQPDTKAHPPRPTPSCFFSVPPGREAGYRCVNYRRDIPRMVEDRGGSLLLSIMLRRLAQQRMTLSDLEWPYHASRAISAVAELLVKPRIHSVMWAAFDECTTVSFVGTRGS